VPGFPLFAASQDAIISIDASGRVLRWNDAAERVFGYTQHEAVGQLLTSLIVPEGVHATLRCWLERAASPESAWMDARTEAHALRKDGTALTIELTVMRSGEDPPRLTGVIRDLSHDGRADEGPSGMALLLAAAEQLAHVGSWEINLQTGKATWSDEMYRLQGLEPQATAPTPMPMPMPIDVVHADDRERITTLVTGILAAPDQVAADGVAFDFRIVLPDGSVRDVRARGRIDRDASGVPARWVGSAQDVTDERLSERELRAHYAVSQALVDWESFEEGVVGLLRRLGTALEVPMGALWVLDAERQRLTCRAFWTAPGVDGGEFEALSREMQFSRGAGVPGRSFTETLPVVIDDISVGLTGSRRRAAARAGLRSGFTLPAVGHAGVMGVLTFYSSDRRTPSDRFIRTLSGIGQELGRFLEGRRPELGTGRLSVRELQILTLAAGGNSGPAIAQELFLSPATVKTHFEHIYEKLGVGDRAAAVALALRTGLIR
jgi:PAS domain S-box-containing protein